jgi:hypothetical protein
MKSFFRRDLRLDVANSTETILATTTYKQLRDSAVELNCISISRYSLWSRHE